MATKAAIAACGGAGLGFLIDPLSCAHDAAKDPGLTSEEAKVIDKIWCGQTADGSAPDPASDNGGGTGLGGRLWFGWTRCTDLALTPAGGAPGIFLAADQAALSPQDPTLGSQFMANATGNGADRWREALDYQGLARAQKEGLRLQPEFSSINTDDPDLSAFQKGGGRMVLYQGLTEEYIPAQGAIHYYDRSLRGWTGPRRCSRSSACISSPASPIAAGRRARPRSPCRSPPRAATRCSRRCRRGWKRARRRAR